MKKFLTALVFTFALITGSAHALETGRSVPDYHFKDISGVEHSIEGFKGKTVILEWTNPGCPFVQKFYKGGDMQRFQAEALKTPNTVWISINSSGAGKEGALSDFEAIKFVSENNSKASAYVLDPSGAFGKLYGAKTTPHMFVIDKNGKLAYQGAIDSIKSFDPADIAKADNYVLNALKALNKGDQPDPKSTESYGCSVKYAE